MKTIFSLVLGVVIMFPWATFGFAAPVVFNELDIREEGDRAILVIGLKSALSLEVTVSGVHADPISLHMPGNTSQRLKFNILGETQSGYVTFVTSDQKVVSSFKLRRECSMDALKLLACAKDLAGTAWDCQVRNDDRVVFTCGACGLTSAGVLSLITMDSVCTGATTGICSPSYLLLIPLVPVTGASCYLCTQDLALAAFDCAQSTFSLLSSGHCNVCESEIKESPSAPSNFLIR
jgi:hypothetical protein